MDENATFGGGSLSGNRSPSLDEVIQQHVIDALENTRVSQPAKVLKYNEGSGVVEVIPLLRRPIHLKDGTLQYLDFQSITEVPVVFPSGGGRMIKVPIQPGDIVLIVHCDFSIDDWKAGGGADDIHGRTTPRVYGSHCTSDAIAIPGLFNPLGVDPSAAIEIRPDGSIILDEGAQHLLRGDLYRAAQKTLDAAFTAFFTALATYVGAIQGIADPTNVSTVPIVSAIANIKVAIATFDQGPDPYLSRNKTS